MADRLNFYFDQLVTEADLDNAYNFLEQADHRIVADTGLVGVASGLTVAQQTVPDLTVTVAAGVAYDASGQRCAVSNVQTLNMALDANGSATTVVGNGNSKVLSVYISFDRTLTDARIDGNSTALFFSQAEGFELRVVQGAEASTGNETPPGLVAGDVLLADVTISFGQTQIVNANISTARRQASFVLSAGAISVSANTAEESDQAILTELNNHVVGSSNAHPDTAISAALKTGTATNLTAGTVSSQIQEIINELPGLAAANSFTGNNVFGGTITSTFNSPNGITMTGGLSGIRFSDTAGTDNENLIAQLPAVSGTRGRSLALNAQDGNTSVGGDIRLRPGKAGSAVAGNTGRIQFISDTTTNAKRRGVDDYFTPEFRQANGGGANVPIHIVDLSLFPSSSVLGLDVEFFGRQRGTSGWAYGRVAKIIPVGSGGTPLNPAQVNLVTFTAAGGTNPPSNAEVEVVGGIVAVRITFASQSGASTEWQVQTRVRISYAQTGSTPDQT